MHDRRFAAALARLPKLLTRWLLAAVAAGGLLVAGRFASRLHAPSDAAPPETAPRETAPSAARAAAGDALAQSPAVARPPVELEDEPEFHTFSICAVDPAAAQCGVAVTTRVTLVGRYVPWVRAGVGAVATQATTQVKYGPQGLDLLEGGVPPSEALAQLLEGDEHRESRQVALVDMQGRAAAHTGANNGVYAGSRQGKNYSVQGNLLIGRQVIDAVADAFEETEGSSMPLADRLIAALEAGQATGGDKRQGRAQSAAVIVADAQRAGVNGDQIAETLQVAEHPEPVAELRRQYDTIHQQPGYREFALTRGRDVVELKRMLHQLKLLWPERTDFPRRDEMPQLDQYDQEAAAAVDGFRQAQGLPVAADGLGHEPGIVDRPLVRRLKAAYYQSLKGAGAAHVGSAVRAGAPPAAR